MTDGSRDDTPGRRYLGWFGLVFSVVVFLPLVLQPQFRKLFALSLLGIAYSLFIISTWRRWVRRAGRLNQEKLGGFIPLGMLRSVLKLFPVKAWGVVPCVIQLIVVGVIAICGWFLGPLIYKLLRNPATPGIIRDALQSSAPELFNFLSALASNQDPVLVLRQNVQQVFSNVNRFLSAFVFPVTFIVFTSVGASLYRSLERFLLREEGKNEESYSAILNDYSILFMEYITFNLLYYFLLSLVIGSGLGLLGAFGVTSFGWKLIAGILVSYIAGNLIIPGLGTLVMTALVVGLLFADAGWFIAGLFLLIFGIYVLLDDYLIKPFFLVRVGGSPRRNWEFGVEVIIFGFLVLYSTFGLIGILLLFPVLCFLSAYLRNQYPELRPWILQPIQHLRQ